MASNISIPTGVLYETDVEVKASSIPKEVVKPAKHKFVIKWRNVVLIASFHVFAIYGLFLLPSAKIGTILTGIVTYILHGLGIYAGVHRLWAHKSYEVKLPLKIFLAFCNTLAYEGSIFRWTRDHRVHHKYSETDADPHNAKRGFFFAHMGWLLCSKHPEVKKKGDGIDISDLLADPVVMFQNKHYFKLMPIISFGLPIAIPMYFWGETFVTAVCINMLRYILAVHATWSINSFTHMWGQKPYDKYINPTENLLVSIASFGEGWHNYHHTFPWDYKASELGRSSANLSTVFIDFMAKLGLAYDLKTVSNKMLRNRMMRTGDGTQPIWGWGDKDQQKTNCDGATITYKKD